MSRWKVARHEVTSWLGTSYQWCVMDADNWQIRDFNTWREALAYADRVARTREYVLPRVAPQGEVSVSATWYCDQGAIHYINSAGQVVQGTPAELRPLALALLALAEQEEHA